jgi:hypothetical protein
MDTEHTAAAPATAPENAAKPGKPAKAEPANRLYVFAKNCTNDHGHFAKGDKARGAFSDELVQSYLAAGVLAPKDTAA